jgi:hypothetical protein
MPSKKKFTAVGGVGARPFALQNKISTQASRVVSAAPSPAPAPAPAPAPVLCQISVGCSDVPHLLGSHPPVPSPMSDKDTPVDWMFAFKFNAHSFNECDFASLPHHGIFGGTKKSYSTAHSQDYVFATNKSPTLKRGTGCLGATENDPLGATFSHIYNNDNFFYVVWNDQFHGYPIENKDDHWGHSKGMLVWNSAGEGMVLQVSTPSWPGSGSKAHPRKLDGNTLGYIEDNNIEASQHFFALKLANTSEVIDVLAALINASVVTDVSKLSIVKNGPLNASGDIKTLVQMVKNLGTLSSSQKVTNKTIHNDLVQIISKPSKLHVPPWQIVSAQLKLDLRVATWWEDPAIHSTAHGTVPVCWDATLGTPHGVEIATTGQWPTGVSNVTHFGLEGGVGPNFNHAKIGISKNPSSSSHYCIFGDLNQQGTLGTHGGNKDQCDTSQNARGGIFFVLNNQTLCDSLRNSLLKGYSAPLHS